MKIPQVTINKWLKKYGYLPQVSFYGAKRLDGLSSDIKKAKDKLALFYDDPDDIEKIILTPRCDCPDFEDPSLSLGVFGAAGSGSWPSTGCDPENPGIHSIRIGIDTRNAPTIVKNYLREALNLNVKAFAEIGLSVRYILDPKPGQKVEISKVFGGLGGSTIGWNYFYQGGCNTITGKLSSRWAPQSVLFWATLECHESLHGCGIRHVNSRKSIMHPQIQQLSELSIKNDVIYPTIKKMFGGQPLDNTPDPIPPKPDDPTPIPPKPTPDENDTILERILERLRNFLGGCAKREGTDNVKRRLKARGLRERIQLRKIVREETPKEKQKEIYGLVLKEWYEADDEELSMLTDFLPDKFEI